jgi:hypothetical protein
VSKKQHQTKHHDRSHHDAAARHHVEEVYETEQPRWVRYTLIGLASIIVVTLTLLFVGGFIRW